MAPAAAPAPGVPGSGAGATAPGGESGDPMDASERETNPAEPPLDAELCSFGSVAAWLISLNHAGLVELAEICPPRPLPPKARARRNRLWWALLLRWTDPEARTFLLHGLTGMLAGEIERVRGDPAALALPNEKLPGVVWLWLALEAGMAPEVAWAALSAETREAVAAAAETVRDLHDAVLRNRQARLDWAEDSSHRRVQAEVDRATRHLRVRTEQVEQKSTRAQRAAEAVIRRHADEVRRLEAELEAKLRRIAELERELAAVREQQRDLSRQHAQELASLRDRARAESPPAPGPPPLCGQSVLVVGDEGRQTEYRRIVEAMGGEFTFLPGFGNPTRIEAAAAGATLLVFITAWASHKAFTHARAAEQAGVPLLLVPQAGAARFRDALEQWVERRSGPARQA
jgi:hypothetical protein